MRVSKARGYFTTTTPKLCKVLTLTSANTAIKNSQDNNPHSVSTTGTRASPTNLKKHVKQTTKKNKNNETKGAVVVLQRAASSWTMKHHLADSLGKLHGVTQQADQEHTAYMRQHR